MQSGLNRPFANNTPAKYSSATTSIIPDPHMPAAKCRGCSCGDASSDMSLLKNTADIEVKSILDLRPAVELLDYEKKDLHSVVAFEL